MTTKYLIKKQLALVPCKFILGVIAPSRELTPSLNPDFLDAIENGFKVESLLPAQSLPNPPESYIEEMRENDLSTSIFVLGERGSYTDLHHLKRRAMKLEERFMDSQGRRAFNINPGAVGSHGLCLASHKDTGGRINLSANAYGFHLHTLFGGNTDYERIMKWENDRLELVGKAKDGGKFPEYSGEGRVVVFEELVRTLPKNNVSVELMSDYYGIEPLFDF